MPDPFDPRFAAAVDEMARNAAARFRRDPWLVGYFVDNELSWGRGWSTDPREHYALADNIRSIGDLRGKSVGGVAARGLIAILTAWVGIDPEKDLTVVEDPAAKPLEQFVQGELDAYLGFPPEPQELHARKVGHVILRTAVDRPWSQYYCCMLAGNREFVRKHPVATKRAIRALLKAADFCASQPERSARLLVEDGFVPRYDYALETLREVPYGLWREYDAEDTVRFWALRAHELGFVKSIPQKISARGTDFRFFNELKRELKA
jgi:NitT/TauT family transport system substrate-binding protein